MSDISPHPPIEIFKAGTHRAMSGAELSFMEADLAAMAAAYDPAVHEAPLVIGHPTHDAPAYGWVGGLEYSEGTLKATPSSLDPGLVDMVRRGNFKRVSASLYLPDAPTNPKPGAYYLRHVGFLGAMPPAVKGLKPANFSEAEDGIVEFGDLEDQIEAGVFRRLRDWIVARFGLDEAEKAIPSQSVDTLQALASQKEVMPTQAPGPIYAESPPPPVPEPDPTEDQTMNDEIRAKQAELEAKEQAVNEALAAIEAREANIAAIEAGMKAKETEAQKEAALAYAESLVQAGKVRGALKASVANLLIHLQNPGTADFAEEESPVEALKAVLNEIKSPVEFGEMKEASDQHEPMATADFVAPPGYTVDADRLALHGKAVAYMQENPGSDYLTAIVRLTTKG
jgi:hypothetical protein